MASARFISSDNDLFSFVRLQTANTNQYKGQYCHKHNNNNNTNSPPFMNPEGSWPVPYSQDSSTHPYPESAESSSNLKSCFFQIHFNIILSYAPRSPMCLALSGFLNTILYTLFISPTSETFSAHLILPDPINIVIYKFETFHLSIRLNKRYYCIEYLCCIYYWIIKDE